jgi:cell fate regulator YaaT (PSP1 superfamily)
MVGFAGAEDLRRDEVIRRAKADGTVAARRLIRAHELPMKVVAVDHVPAPAAGGGHATSSGAKTTIYFTAPHRVDFRALVRDLGATLHCRVELRQISARDSARVQGGIGSCGRDLCCATFLTDFEPVTIRMAKDQDLPLNPMRIAGACGRLMCCLKYEHPLYESAGSYPANGSTVETPDGSARVISKFPPGESVALRMLADGSVQRCPVASTCGSRRAFESR